MKKFFVAMVMAITIMMTGLVNTAFAGSMIDCNGGEDFDKFETLMDDYAYVMAYHSNAREYTLISQKIYIDKCINSDGLYYDYVWEVTAYNHETNEYIKETMWIGNGERVETIIEELETLKGEI